MTAIDEYGRPEPPTDADEAATLLGFLEFQRATLGWKTQGLDAAGLRATTAASTMTLGGMLKHLALVEDHWFSFWLRGNEKGAAWADVDWDADPDWEWHSAVDDTPERLRELWLESLGTSRAMVAATLAEDGLGQMSARVWRDGRHQSLRWIICHMIEEYARHNGHADLIRESIDGQTGE
jgi:uncharacterized damage-inducible protein DinB